LQAPRAQALLLPLLQRALLPPWTRPQVRLLPPCR